MDPRKTNSHHEIEAGIDEPSLLNYENTGKGITKRNTEKNSSELNEKQILNEYFVPRSIKQEKIDIKSEEDEGDQFSINEYCDKQILDEYFDSESINKQEETVIKTENEEGNEFSTDEFNEKQIKEEYDAPELIRPEEIDFKNEDEDKDSFSIESSPVESGKEATCLSKLFAKKEAVFKCLKCCYQTHSKRNIKRHALGHMPKAFNCPLCPDKFKSRHLLRQHQVVHIPEEEAKLHKCPQCDFSTKRKGSLIAHLLIHKKPDEINWYQCPECPYKTKHKSYFQYQHILLHKNVHPTHQCTLCPYASFNRAHLKRHLDHVHRPKDIPLISCPEEGCSYKTEFPSYLESHIRRLHICQKILKCSECHYETTHLRNLKAHKLKHENPGKRFSCHLCPYKTTSRFNLNRHAVTHESTSEIKEFECLESKRNNASPHHNLNHRSEVEEFTGWFYCYVCTWRTRHKKSLARHIKTKHRNAEGRICGQF